MVITQFILGSSYEAYNLALTTPLSQVYSCFDGHFWISVSPSSVVFIFGCYPWMTSMDGRVTNRWHPQMALSSMNDTYEWHFQNSQYSKEEQFSSRNMTDESVICDCYPWMTLPSVDAIQGWQPWMKKTDDWHGWSHYDCNIPPAEEFMLSWCPLSSINSQSK